MLELKALYGYGNQRIFNIHELLRAKITAKSHGEIMGEIMQTRLK
jgi:hypothetical protein